jgi:hypothetical protein
MAISEWDQRQLCPDGACIGLIGPDGTCKVCGRVAPDWGDERRRGLVAEEGAPGEEASAQGDAVDEILPAAPAALGEAATWQRRRLCSDGACIGVIGPDGICKVCGKPDGAPAEAAAAAKGAEGESEEGEDEEDEDEDESDEQDEASAEGDEDEDEEDEDDEDGDEDEDDEDGDDEDEDEDEGSEEDGGGDADKAAAGGGSELDDRKLCPDGACIGVIGDDGRCKVCGKEAA